MGCTASKLENEDTVRRCKERRRLMKDAVLSRHHLSSAHSDYLRSLLLTGAALSTFAAGEPLPVSATTPAVLLRHPSTPSPPPRKKQQQPIKLPHILSDSSPCYTPMKKKHESFTHHARANSTVSNTPSQTESSVWNWENFYPPSPPDSEFFEKKKSKPGPEVTDFDGVVENDDKGSFFSTSSRYTHKSRGGVEHHMENSHDEVNDLKNSGPGEGFVGGFDNDDKDSVFSTSSRYTHKSRGGVEQFMGNSHGEVNDLKKSGPEKGFVGVVDNDDKDSFFSSLSRYTRKSGSEVKHQKSRVENRRWEGEETEREKVECSEWGDHDRYSTTSSSDVEGDEEEEEGGYDDLRSRSNLGSRSQSDIGTRSNFGSAGNGSVLGGGVKQGNLGGKYHSKLEKLSDDVESSSWGYGKEREVEDRKIVVKHKDLVEIIAAIKEYFDKAAAAGEQVSEMLETGRAQLSQLKKTVYHSSGLLSNLSSTWTSKPPLAVKYRFEPSSIELAGGATSLCSTLERLFAWEKKLYEEVKAREGVKIAHEKKLSTLQSQEAKGEEEAKLEKTKTSINKLQSLILVTSQAVSTTSTAIIGLRDSELVPQLVELCHGFMYMWRSMNHFHEVQNDIVQQVRGLVSQSNKGESTSDLHRQATRDLESAVSAWHSSFCRLIKFQRDFIHSLHGWFKLSLVPVANVPNEVNRKPTEAFGFCDEWKLALDRVPDTVASEAIKSFINVVHSISTKQTEEVKLKKRTENASKELEKKASSLRTIEKKYYNTYSVVGLGIPDSGPDNGHALDARDPLVEKKSELAACQRRVEDEILKHSRSVEVTRAMTLNNIQTGLPAVFQALTSFSSLFVEALETVCTHSYAISR